jgi:hypothetical protein
MMVLKRILFSILFVVGLSLFFYRLSGYNFIKEIYPDDGINIAFFMLKVLREVALWFVTCMPITFLVFHLMSYRDKITYILSAVQIIAHIVGLALLVTFCNNVNKTGGIITFVLYAAVVLVVAGCNRFYYKSILNKAKVVNTNENKEESAEVSNGQEENEE